MHFSLEEWVDFARQRAPVESVAQMQDHLGSGCAACAKVLGVWRSVLEIAQRESGFELPERGARFAKALYSVAGPERQSLPVHFARLLFSSFAEPVRAGIRGGEAPTGHFLYEVGNWLVDLQVKPLAERRLVSVAGQVLERVCSDTAYDGHVIAVMREKVELARTTTNEFGEFHLEFTPGDNLLLTVNLKGESILVSVLPAYPSERGASEN